MPRARGARTATIYDAVAERLEAQGFIDPVHAGLDEADPDPDPSIKPVEKFHPITPEEALFRVKGAPDRYEEDDIYDHARFLEPGQLPESDLLKAIHAYVSDFYSRATVNAGQDDFRSMDETALMACGFLLEEACKEILGATGDMVFTEGDAEGLLTDEPANGSDAVRSRPEDSDTNDTDSPEPEKPQKADSKPARKRRRIDKKPNKMSKKIFGRPKRRFSMESLSTAFKRCEELR